MSKITIDRSVVEQALTYLGDEAPLCSGCAYEWGAAIRVLRAALEQPDTNTASEPVAWRCFDGEGDFEYYSEEPSEETRAWSARYNREWEPLYLHPQPRQQQVQQDKAGWVDEIIEDFKAQYDAEGIRELDSGDALIRLEQAISAVKEAAQGYSNTQPSRKPMTQEQIVKLIVPGNYLTLAGVIKLMRAVEEFHNIKE